MNATGPIQRVRNILRDNQNIVRKGEFWDTEREIVPVLNACQDIFLNYCLRNNMPYMLKGLITTTAFGVSGALPADYLHYISGMVGLIETTLKTARIYLGGEGDYYRYVAHKAVIIIGSNLYFTDGSLPAPKGILTYYRRPSRITTDTASPDYLLQEFEDNIYYDIIVNQAAVILALKETQTQREFKKARRVLQNIVLYPAGITAYNVDYDKAVEVKQ